MFADLPEQADTSESPSPPAEDFVIRTQSEVDAALHAAVQAPVKAEEDSALELSSDLVPLQPVDDNFQQENTIPLAALAQAAQQHDVAQQDMLLQHKDLPVADNIKQESHIPVADSTQGAQQHDLTQLDIPLQRAELPVKDDAEQENSIPIPQLAQGAQQSDLVQHDNIPPPAQAQQDSAASDQHSVSKQATTENYSSSIPSNTSHTTVDRDSVHQSVGSPAEALDLQPAASQQQGGVIAEAQQTEAAAAAAAAVQPADGASQPLTVDQVVAQGQYVVDSAQRQKLAVNLETYKKRVDELQSQGKVRQQTHFQHPRGIQS